MVAIHPSPEEIRERLEWDTALFGKYCLRILPKEIGRGLIPFELNPAQRALDEKLEEQRRSGKPQRAVVLKARRVGISTYVQAKLIQRSIFVQFHKSLVVAHDSDTGAELYGIGKKMYDHLPPELKPETRSHRRGRFLHFGPKGSNWTGDFFPDSEYFVDTAGEFEAGRGTARHAMHWSEFGFWPQPEQKRRALIAVLNNDPDTLLVNESTANGHNAFKDEWENAAEGISEFVAFFWPWWKQDEYLRPFGDEDERDRFEVGNTEQSPFAEEEPALADPGPIDTESGRCVPLSKEQLNWRRWQIANMYGGRIASFHQENPATPEQAFLATGQKVFEPILVARVIAQAEQTDPRLGAGGPPRGRLKARRMVMKAGRHGKNEAPEDPHFVPAKLLVPGEDADWRFWLPLEGEELRIEEEDNYVIGADVSEGLPESGEGDPAYQALCVIDHRTRRQVAEYRSRVDPKLFGVHALLTAQLFNDAWLAIEKTGPGLAVVRDIWHDYHYPFVYRRKKHEAVGESETDLLGWHTSRPSKALLVAGAEELLREDSHGIRSRRLANEMLTYVREDSGKMVPEPGRFADLLMAWMIAQQVAHELPLRRHVDVKPRRERNHSHRRYSAFRR